MATRHVQFKPDAKIVPCPKCGNKTHFTIHSDYCAEDCCEAKFEGDVEARAKFDRGMASIVALQSKH